MIAGAPGAFSAGNDLQEFLQAATVDRRGLGSSGRPISSMRWRARERPLVAAVQGVAVGVGTTMLLHCDHVVAGTDARFSTPFVGLGLVPEAASSLLAPRLMGHRRAFALLVDGPAARRRGGAGLRPGQHRGAPGEVDAAGDEGRSARSRRCRPRRSRSSRRLLRGLARRDRRAHRRGGRLFKQRLQSAEARAAFEAFLNAQALIRRLIACRSKARPCSSPAPRAASGLRSRSDARATAPTSRSPPRPRRRIPSSKARSTPRPSRSRRPAAGRCRSSSTCATKTR